MRITTWNYQHYIYHFTTWARKYQEEINPKYNFLKDICNSPKKFAIRDIETDEIIVYSSMYKDAKAFNQQSRLIYAYDEKVWMKRYAIKVLTESH